MGNTLKALHDELLASKPDAVEHNAGTCPFCVLEAASETSETDSNPEGDPVSDTSYTEEELAARVDAAVAEATKPLLEKIESFASAEGVAEIEAAIEAAVAEASEKTAELQTKLDETVLELSKVTEAHDELVSFLEAENKAAEEAAELEARLTERLEKVTAEVAFPEDYVDDDFKARLAAMTEETFESSLESWKTLAPKTDDEAGDPPAATALDAARDGDATAPKSAVTSEALGALRAHRTTVQTIR